MFNKKYGIISTVLVEHSVYKTEKGVKSYQLTVCSVHVAKEYNFAKQLKWVGNFFDVCFPMLKIRLAGMAKNHFVTNFVIIFSAIQFMPMHVLCQEKYFQPWQKYFIPWPIGLVLCVNAVHVHDS